MQKLWLVGSGYYSDRSEVCVCPTEEIAEAVRDKYGRHSGFGDDYWIEEIVLVEDPSEVTTRKVYEYTLSLDAGLNLREGHGVYEREDITTGYEWLPEGAELHEPIEGTVRGFPYLHARSYVSAEAAKKAAYDKLAEARAMREGI